MSDAIEIVDEKRDPITLDEMRKLMSWSWGEKGLLIADLWDAFNGRYWQGRLVPVPIWFPAASPYGLWTGQYTGGPDCTSHHIQLVRGLSSQETANTLLHEMIHQYLHESGQSASHNAWPWCNEIMRLTKLIWGREIYASPSQPRKVNGKSQRIQKQGPNGEASIPRKHIASWPHSIGLHAPMGKGPGK